ncbi:hypothetical protein [Sedimentitalea todarodis]|uniref:Uncharacterized protein n=1 Tax=Sedimentitalea todarodis TaxID=1631240 RepID=A0ABU3VK10_9RHOB|nr:hypothetical protein [Sedimentitalea todarodis]MDU9006532.1 hypothetical protein [Sedimentitalea todarodis]
MSPAEALYIGCGPAPDIDPDAERVVLVEPNPDHVPVLRAQVRKMGNRVRLIPAAVAADTGRAPFHICNFSDLSGLEVPAALFELMPGLRQVKTAQVQTLSVADLLRQARIRSDGYALRCEACGVVPQLLNQLLAEQELDRVATLWLTVGAEPFHGPGSDADSVIGLLQDHGYRLLAREDEADPDWPCLKFEQDRALLDLTRARDAARAAAAAAQRTLETERAGMQAQLEAAVKNARTDGQAQIEAMQADLANVQDRAKALDAQRERLRADLETARAETASLRSALEKSATERTALKERLASATGERDAAHATTETVRTNTRAQIAAAQAETADLQKRVEALSQEAERLQTEVETTGAKTRAELKAAQEARAAAEAQLAGARTARAEVQAQLTTSGTEIAALQERVAALIRDRDTQRAAAETARTDLGMALRMQAMAAADLKDLQERHTVLSATKDRQDAVLGQLALQLGDVSEHLQQIEAAPAAPRLQRDTTAKKDGA